VVFLVVLVDMAVQTQCKLAMVVLPQALAEGPFVFEIGRE